MISRGGAPAVKPATIAEIAPARRTKGRTRETLPDRTAEIKAALDTPETPVEPQKPPQRASRGNGRTREAVAAASSKLEALGWSTAGKGWVENGVTLAAMTATRGTEMLVLSWRDGVLVSQNYSLWDVSKPSNNGMPPAELDFDPDETSDSELVRRISGMKVTWWNRIAQDEETAIVDPAKIQIEHGFNPNGDETPGERVVKFLDYGGMGFRAFRVDALVRIG